MNVLRDYYQSLIHKDTNIFNIIIYIIFNLHTNIFIIIIIRLCMSCYQNSIHCAHCEETTCAAVYGTVPTSPASTTDVGQSNNAAGEGTDGTVPTSPASTTDVGQSNNAAVEGTDGTVPTSPPSTTDVAENDTDKEEAAQKNIEASWKKAETEEKKKLEALKAAAAIEAAYKTATEVANTTKEVAAHLSGKDIDSTLKMLEDIPVPRAVDGSNNGSSIESYEGIPPMKREDYVRNRKFYLDFADSYVSTNNTIKLVWKNKGVEEILTLDQLAALQEYG